MAAPDPFAEQQAQFDSAFAQAAVKPAKPVDPSAPLPFVPAHRYIEKNLAPEQTLTYGDVAALASARRLAEEKGLITPEVGAHMLPIAMVEGRGSLGPRGTGTVGAQDFGVNQGNTFYASAPSLKRFKDMGLSITDMTDPAVVEKQRYDSVEYPELMTPGNYERFRADPSLLEPKYFRHVTIPGPNGPMTAKVLIDAPPPVGAAVLENYPAQGKDKFLRVMGGETTEEKARVMAYVLAEKHAVNKSGEAEKTVRAYNGAGPATDQYWAKVQAAKALLDHPRNAKLMQHYNSVYLKGK
jgi:hypothetical protein